MKRLFSLARLAGRSEKLLLEAQLKQMSRKTGLVSLAGVIAVFGLAMLNVAIFFFLQPYWGSAGAGFAVAALDFSIAGVLVFLAQRSEGEVRIEEIRSVRDRVITELENEASVIESELTQVRKEVQNFLHNPLDNFKPSLIVPLMKAAAEGLRSVNKTNGTPQPHKEPYPPR